MTRVSRTLVAGLSALAMAAAVVLPVTPASAGGFGAAVDSMAVASTAVASTAAVGAAAVGMAAAAGADAAFGTAAIGAAAIGTTAGGAPAIAAGVIGGAALCQLPLLGRRLWVRRWRLLAGSADL